MREVSGFRRRVVEALSFLRSYRAYIGSLPTFRNSLLVPSLRMMKSEDQISSTSYQIKVKRFTYNNLCCPFVAIVTDINITATAFLSSCMLL